VVTLLMPKTYQATAAILVDNRDEQSLNGTVASGRERVGWMQTQIDILSSERVAKKAVADMKLAENPQVQQAFRESGEAGTIEDWLARALLLGLKIDATQSNVIQIHYAAKDPKFAAAAANGIAKAYMDQTLALRVDPTKQAAGWFEEQLKGLRTQFENAQAKLAKFQQEKGIIATDERVDIEYARLAALDTQSLAAANSANDAAVRLNGGTASLPDVISNPVIQSLKGELMRAEANLSQLGTRLGPAHPEYVQAQQQVEALRSRMNGEMGRIVGGVKNVTAQQRQREAEMKAALAAQRARVMEMRDARNQAMVLQRDVETAQKAYEAAHARYLVNKVESGARQSNVTLLNPATEPSRPAKPRKLVNIALGLILGVILGLGAVFLLEIFDRRVRSTNDLYEGLDAPLLGELQEWRPSRLLGGPDGNTRALPSPA
jgi:chain length determinant protein EpsF